ncbi:MAG: glycogen/starch/alpha-glucan phosphorylase, partial [Verrucomicrobia bacterium]|nr:glycogen/starch/alpha-glucan phosphorylase [Verrucomicrobiota bacterium]
LKRDVLPDFVAMWPEKFSNKTNGVSPRRFVMLSNPGLSQLITDRIDGDWLKHLDELRKLEPLAADAEFQQQWREVKLANKRRLAAVIKERTGVVVDPETMFDIQVKRIHEYKRQHLNVLRILTLYNRVKRNPKAAIVPRTFIFGGKAAPGYFMAKLIIKLIHAVGDLVNNDRDVRGRLKVVFFPDFNVKNAQSIYPAADLSEQISLAGTEASGTGNMKFALNGALTIGTLDGANIEIRQEVGKENFFLFGLTAEEVQALRARGYNPRDCCEQNAELQAVMDLIGSGALARGDARLFRPLVDSLLWHDPFMVLADYSLYMDCQERVATAWRDTSKWTRRSIVTVARMGKFSADRAVREYCEEIWKAKPVPVVVRSRSCKACEPEDAAAERPGKRAKGDD